MIAFTTSSFFQTPSAAFAGRVASDPPGSTRTFAIYKNGTDSYVDFAVRWGDYSGVSLDPDGSTTWSIVEYAGSPDPHFVTSSAHIPAPPSLTISPASLDFGSQNYGTMSTPHALTLTNSGTTPMVVNSVSLAVGPFAGDFVISSDPCSGMTLAAGGNCSVELVFAPFHPGTLTAGISITFSPQGSLPGTTTVPLVGTTIAGVATLTPTTVNFPATPVRTASAPIAVTLSNTGNAPMGVGPITIVVGDFTETNNCPLVLAAGANCTVNVTFRPTGMGAGQGTLDVSNTAPGGTVFVNMTGTPSTAPAVTLCPTSLTFASQAVGTTSPPQVATVSNTGSADLTVNAAAVTGDFAQTNTCGALPAFCGYNVLC